jgi:hypothetical protein
VSTLNATVRSDIPRRAAVAKEAACFRERVPPQAPAAQKEAAAGVSSPFYAAWARLAMASGQTRTENRMAGKG